MSSLLFTLNPAWAHHYMPSAVEFLISNIFRFVSYGCFVLAGWCVFAMFVNEFLSDGDFRVPSFWVFFLLVVVGMFSGVFSNPLIWVY